MVPRATYRLQLNAKFTFQDAIRIIPFLSDLGISHVYCSPYFRARPGSTHGYDIVDHETLNPEIGTCADFEAFVATLRKFEMGHIVDFVPNHVGIGPDNAWWFDVLKEGPRSAYADFFDIDWHDPPKLLLPALGDSYGAVLERGELVLERSGNGGGAFVRYRDNRFPLSMASEAMVIAGHGGEDAESLHRLLEAQTYRLRSWRVAADEINYRRFFDVNDLAALRMENAPVFDATHGLVLDLLRTHQLDGLRIDHPDGLYDPAGYFSRLQEHARAATGDEIYLVVEKILASFERLPESWRVSGTTGYGFLNVLNGLFVDRRASKRLQLIYQQFVQDYTSWQDIAYESKKEILVRSFAAELSLLSRRLTALAGADRRTRDFTYNTLRKALIELIACFPVYRTYVDSGASQTDCRYVDWALTWARRRRPEIDESVWGFVRGAVLQESAASSPFARALQQLTGPVAAKGIEDTALYRYPCLSSLNEVGGDPGRFGVTLRAFHADATYRQKHWPFEMLSTSTHDTKRSEDVRARISVLSEMPALWKRVLARWRRINSPRKRLVQGRFAPGASLEYLFYQTLIGSFPTERMDEAARCDYVTRLQDYCVKAAREAKRRTSWVESSAEYEEAVRQFVAAVLEPRETNAFLPDITTIAAGLQRFGLLNALSQVLCKLTAPGVPDFYQGTETWDFSLLDPDNRRPVDFDRRRAMLGALRDQYPPTPQLAQQLIASLADGRAKLHVIGVALQFRRRNESLFKNGRYLPLRVVGDRASHLLAYMRHLPRHPGAASGPDAAAIVLAPRLFARLIGKEAPHQWNSEVWGNTKVILPRSITLADFTNIMDGALVTMEASGEATSGVAPSLLVRHALQNFPVAVLASNGCCTNEAAVSS